MNRSIEQALTSLLPRLNDDLPTTLLDLASSLLAQSRTRASTLKAEEEIGRTYACAHIACERLKQTLNLPPIEARPPCPPKVYNHLYTYLLSELAPRKRGRPRKDPNAPPTPSKPRSKPSSSLSTPTKARAVPHRPIPGKDRALRPFRRRKGLLAELSNGHDVAPWIHPTIRALCADQEAEAAGPHVLAGTVSVLTLPRPRPHQPGDAEGMGGVQNGEGGEKNGGKGKKEKIPAMIAALYILVHTRLIGRETTGKEYMALRKCVLESLRRIREDEALLAKVADLEKRQGILQEKSWEGWEDIGKADVDRWLMDLSEDGWVGMDWFENIVAGSGLKVPDGQTPMWDEDLYEEEDEEDIERAEEELEEEEGAQMGLGTMMQDRVDYLSADKTEKYEAWKEKIMKKIAAIEKSIEKQKKPESPNRERESMSTTKG